MEQAAQTVIEAVHSIWDEWSQRGESFGNEPEEMQPAFRNSLRSRLPVGWWVEPKDAYPFGCPKRFTAWSAYDVGVRDHSQWVALLELSLDDTTVCHALHNGENKLLGICAGIGVETRRAFSQDRGLDAADIAFAQRQLASIPVRGLFFISRHRKHELDVPDRPIWTDGKSKPYMSARMSSHAQVTLRQVFDWLAGAGVHCWFYSLISDQRIELPPYVRAPN